MHMMHGIAQIFCKNSSSIFCQQCSVRATSGGSSAQRMFAPERGDDYSL